MKEIQPEIDIPARKIRPEISTDICTEWLSVRPVPLRKSEGNTEIRGNPDIFRHYKPGLKGRGIHSEFRFGRITEISRKETLKTFFGGTESGPAGHVHPLPD